ncbi:hypothetical protein O181_082217 [Austropuccinia psidii MF-1]|uniref:Secreted protein n=1 Tax=Austropuccinia psidii MF-1 TaxID=1389203 RepID=A0A9Q3IJ10_9BASI|nr:hypothetical protein [Austropuccinia psidii MF-1]
MAHVQWDATVHESWLLALLFTHILALFQNPDTSQANPYTFPGSQLCAHKFLRLYRFPTIQATPSTGEGSHQFQQFLMPVQAPDASNANLYTWKGS